MTTNNLINTRLYDVNVAIPDGETFGDRIDRLLFIDDSMEALSHSAYHRIAVQAYVHPDTKAEVTEITMVYQVARRHDMDEDDFLQAIGEISALLGEDCIAVHHLASNTGYLCGPRAQKWLPFNSSFFHSFN